MDIESSYIYDTPQGRYVRRGEVWTTVTQSGDPAMQLLENPNIYSVPNDSILKDNCYICVDPEFAAMGLPLCYPCVACGAHVAADDAVCDNGHDQYEIWLDGQDEVDRPELH